MMNYGLPETQNRPINLNDNNNDNVYVHTLMRIIRNVFVCLFFFMCACMYVCVPGDVLTVKRIEKIK